MNPAPDHLLAGLSVALLATEPLELRPLRTLRDALESAGVVVATYAWGDAGLRVMAGTVDAMEPGPAGANLDAGAFDGVLVLGTAEAAGALARGNAAFFERLGELAIPVGAVGGGVQALQGLPPGRVLVADGSGALDGFCRAFRAVLGERRRAAGLDAGNAVASAAGEDG